MIDVKELRIGNAVFVGGKLKWVNHRLISDLASDPEQRGRKDGYKITPIPLAEEWLVRFGLERNPSFYSIYWRHKSGLSFSFADGQSSGLGWSDHSEKHDPSYNYRRPPLQFVHQLQNLVHALKGEELEMKQA